MTTTRLGAEEIRRVVAAFRDGLRSHQALVNRLNVYPVPDGDTGTNMALTLESVVGELEGADADLASTCKAISHGSLMGARGNSGVLLSGILRGVAVTVSEADGLDGPTLARALRAASDGAYAAVPRPVEGTILTVIREAAEAAEACTASAPEAALVDVGEAALAQGRDALARTPEMLPVLKQAGVVDSGGTGLLLLLDALLHVVDGRPLPDPPDGDEVPAADLDALREHTDAGDHDGHDVGDLRYEVMYFLEAPDEAIPAFKKVWGGIGDSIVVVGGDGLWNCHIHTDDIGASIEAAVDIGRPRNIRVTDLMEEVEEERWVREGAEAAASEPDPPLEHVPTAVVAVATGDGVRRLFTSMGVQIVVTGGQTMNPSTQDLVAAVEATAADEVVLLPNNKNIVPVAEQVDALASKKVVVVPTRGVSEGVAALVAYDPEAPSAANVESMGAAVAAVVAGEVTRAVRDSDCSVGPIRAGDWLGIDRRDIRVVGPDLGEVVCGLLDVLLGDDHEIVTLIEGEGSSAAVTRHVTEWLGDAHPEVEAEVLHGGQPLYPYYVGIE
ncbi:DAK2 domain-containing protein [Iamia sp. SCSIO 61187]|uniref:DAK2 domain-containing protein n=1 Tax=Iamia sp. SCSIO 61187 TaxID=2722752 RepID=UPI001C638632|nr:DAK2 domain-containing protein [Iamia sp. SCSIO 61187]QYG92078.1 DAK2 domain-containing protein [Iamia sp. SCSIO 61187]